MTERTGFLDLAEVFVVPEVEPVVFVSEVVVVVEVVVIVFLGLVKCE